MESSSISKSKRWFWHEPQREKDRVEKQQPSKSSSISKSKRWFWHEAQREKDRVEKQQRSKLREKLLSSKRGARERGLEWKLSDEQAVSMFQQPCFYCGRKPTEPDCHGIDRLDNAIGYESANCAPCCARDNFAKGTMSMLEYVAMCAQVASRFPDSRSVQLSVNVTHE